MALHLQRILRLLTATQACFMLVACDAGDHGLRPGADGGAANVASPNLPTRADLPEFCKRPKQDTVRDVFCAEEAPDIRSLVDLEAKLGLAYPALEGGTTEVNNVNGYAIALNPRLVLLGHSTALSGAVVSPINPRLILFGPTDFLAFNRGVQQVELATRNRDDYGLNFYLVTFDQACNASPAGCRPGDLYTPRIESGWTNVHIADDEELQNTPSDCRQCHARGTEKLILLMRELDGPWTHFFMPDQDQPSAVPEPTGVDLVRDYLQAKGDEPYGGIPTAALRVTVGFSLQSAIGSLQPLIFDGSRIMNERWPWSADTGYPSTPSRSATWDRGYASFKRGDQLAMPYFATRQTDAEKQARLTAAYQAYRNGALAAEDLPDLADIFPDDPQTRAEIGLETEPGATPAEALVQACAPCHNDVLDQSISRARFNVDLSRMSAAEIAVAIERLSLPRESSGAMPPKGHRQIHEPNRQALIDFLRGNSRTSADDELLSNAAHVGMAAEQPMDQRPELL